MTPSGTSASFGAQSVYRALKVKAQTNKTKQKDKQLLFGHNHVFFSSVFICVYTVYTVYIKI